MHDAVIRGGTVIDGTGGARFTGDVALDGARIAVVGAVKERGRSEIDARGLYVVPGWVDIHTHYHPFENYNGGSLDEVREMLLDPDTVLGQGAMRGRTWP